MTEVLEAEIAAAIRKYIDENGVLYYQHANSLAAAIMLPVGFALAQAQQFEEPGVGTTSDTAKVKTVKTLEENDLPVPSDLAVEVKSVTTPKTTKRTPRKKKDDDAGTGDRSG